MNLVRVVAGKNSSFVVGLNSKPQNTETHMDSKNINIAVAEQIANLGSSKVVDTVVAQLVEVEIKKRADALASSLKLFEDTRRELNKMRPDQASFDENGAKVSETFSKKAFEDKKKLTEKLAKIDKIIVAATEKDQWGDLYNLSKSGVKEEPTKPDDGATNP
jgi:hypothetical protein